MAWLKRLGPLAGRLFSGIASAVGGLRTYAWLAVGLAVLAFVWWYSERQYDAGYTAAATEYERRDNRALQAQIEKNNTLQAEVNALTAQLLEAEDRAQGYYQTITEEVVRYVPDNPDCDLRRGAVGLLNRAARRDLPDSEHPALTDAEKQTPSTVTQPAAIGHCIGWARQYNELAGRCDALIDVIETIQQRGVPP